MYRVGEVAKLFDINDQTVRVWCKQFADYLGPGANPEKGTTREFTDEDLRVFRYVQYALQRGNTFDEVWSQLSEGNAVKSFEEVFGETVSTAPASGGSGAIVNAHDLLEQYAVTVGRLGEVVQERDYLRGALEIERDAHGQTKERAARAEAQLEVVKALPPPLPLAEPRSAKIGRWVLILGIVAIVALLGVLVFLVMQRGV